MAVRLTVQRSTLKRLARLGVLIGLAAGPLVFATAATAAPAPAAPSGPSMTTAVGEDPKVTAWKEKVKKDAKDPDSVKFASAEFVVDRARGNPNAITTQASAGYPTSGCTLQLVVYKSSSYNSAVSSSLTSCLSQASTIKHTQQLYRLDWWGWDLRRSGSKSAYYTSSMGYDPMDYCTDGNYNTWSSHVRGDVYKYGTWYYADVSASASMYCGGG